MTDWGWPLPRQIYVTGTDTDVGKTVCSALLCAACGYGYWKPVQSGEPGDTETVAALSGARTWPEAWRLPRPASPHAAAADVGARIDPAALRLPDADPLLVEGAGGLMVPYALDPVVWQADLIRALGLPVVVVSRTGLGTLNHTFLTLRALDAEGLPCAGLILVGPPHPENERDLPALGGAPVLARVPRVPDLAASFQDLAADFARQLQRRRPVSSLELR